MSNPDLPVELWLEILAYLPRSTLHKMIGVNRTLFELALNDLYEEVRFISDDKEMMKSFKQLRHEGIAKRVRHLFVRPAFLPGMDEIDSRSKLERKVASGMTYIKHIGKNPSCDETQEALEDSLYPVLDEARKAVKCCPNLREITIMLHDHAITPAFMSFLDSLWASDSIGPNIRKLTIDTTIVKIPLLLKPLDKYSTILTNVEEFDLNLSISRHRHTPTQWYSAIQALASFFTAFGPTITSFSFSSMVMVDLGELFDALPRLPKLRKFEVLAVINGRSLPKPEGFTGFISKHAFTLQTFIIKPQSRHLTFDRSDDEYSVWLNRTDSRKSAKVWSFSELILPNLQNFDVGLRDINLHWGGSDLSTRALLPDLSQVAPNLKKLVMTDVKLSLRRLSNILDTLAHHDGRSILEELAFTSYDLSPQLFDLLSQKLPKLMVLKIEYDGTSSTNNITPFTQIPLLQNTMFHQAMQARTYPTWGLRYLRFLTPNSCGRAHPRILDMKAVAATLLQTVVVDAEFTCSCLV